MDFVCAATTRLTQPEGRDEKHCRETGAAGQERLVQSNSHYLFLWLKNLVQAVFFFSKSSS